jgi:S-methylmethionine-dependent homocysteine/selenocysteine methylase
MMVKGSGHRLATLHDRLARGESVVMDGGMGTGLQAVGVPMDGEAWSGVANLTHANAVRELHAAYLAAGAEILIANTFATGPGPLSAAGYGSRFEEANRNAVAAAVQARADAGLDEVVVAGSMSRDVANGLADTGIPHAVSTDRRALRDAYRRQAEVLVDAGVDVIALEMMGARSHAQPAVAAAAELDIPVWLGISVAAAGRDGAETIDGEDVSQLMSELPIDAIDAVFVMHSDIGLVTDSLHVLRATWEGTVGAYPHVGDWTPPNWVFEEIAPARFADHAGEWVSNGATIVGGCCGIGPEHIRELTKVLT